MSERYDFERAWLDKLSGCLDQVVGVQVRQEVMAGSEGLSADSDRQAVIEWSQAAMARLDTVADEQARREVMTGCACQYPKSALQDVRRTYETTGDADLAHQMLQAKFEAFLRDTLGLSEEHFDEVVSRGWGLAGLKRGNTIIATKIPKSGYLVEYLNETNPERRRQLYCHCPRIRDVLKTKETLSPTYCYCGAGYYKGIWEEILQQPVEVELLESVLKGDEVCKIAIELPEE
jgi:predicted hydrocarbon binding protein